MGGLFIRQKNGNAGTAEETLEIGGVGGFLVSGREASP
jgi:hypothetical protein